jgi:chromate transporter
MNRTPSPPSIPPQPQPQPQQPGHPATAVGWGEALRVWGKVALLSFGGPAGQIAVMHRILVEERRWISERRFLHALNYCMLLPGPEAQQLATYVGWLMHRTLGGLLAGGLFILPGFIAILILSVLYAQYQQMTVVQALFFGLKPAVVAVVIDAVIRIGRRALRNALMLAVAGGAFVAIFFLKISFPWIILSAVAIGLIGGRLWPGIFDIAGQAPAGQDDAGEAPFIADDAAAHTAPTPARALRVLAIGLSLWLVPVAVLVATLGREHIFAREATFFSWMAVVTFGGAYSVLAYVAQAAVETYGWLAPGEMLDGLGMAETTPGPLIMVVQFVGFMGAYRHAGGLDPLAAGVLGAVVTTWVTFTPCFLWIFLGAPYMERLRGSRGLNAALSTVTAAVVGVILNLAVWFSLHTLFGSVAELRYGPLRVLAPVWETVNLPSVVIAAAAFAAVFRLRLNMIAVLGGSAAAGAGYFLLRSG